MAHLFGINSTELVKCLIKPRIKVGNEYVQQGRTEGQVLAYIIYKLAYIILHHVM